MKLESLHLEQFRNYRSQDIRFGGGINILYGNNAQGKTNIVEAIHLLATGKSHRTRHLTDMICHEEDSFSLEAVILDKERESTLFLSYSRRAGRRMTVNEVPRARWSELLGLMHVLLFSPETMDVVKGGPAERRRFLDILLCQIDNRYLRSLVAYTAILRQKTAALREQGSFGRYRDMLPIWNESMARQGGYIAARRIRMIHALEKNANRELDVLSDGREVLSMKLQSFMGKQNLVAEEELSAILLEKLTKLAAREEETGTCLAGIHRDEVLMELNENAARVYASQGQQRSIALSLILASMKLYEEESGEMPILLLDDVMSELDPHRQAYLLHVLSSTQTLITTTDRQTYDNRLPADTTWYQVSSGKVLPVS